jgi:hypothetical protein
LVTGQADATAWEEVKPVTSPNAATNGGADDEPLHRWIEWETLGKDRFSQRDLASRKSAWFASADDALEHIGTALDPYRRPGALRPTPDAVEAARRLLSKAALVELPEPFRVHATAAGGIAIRFHDARHWFLIECFNAGGETATWEDWATHQFTAWVLGEEFWRRSEDELLDQIKALVGQVER